MAPAGVLRKIGFAQRYWCDGAACSFGSLDTRSCNWAAAEASSVEAFGVGCSLLGEAYSCSPVGSCRSNCIGKADSYHNRKGSRILCSKEADADTSSGLVGKLLD